MKKSPFMWVAVGLLVLLLIAIGFGVTQVASLKNEVNETRLLNEQLQLTNDQLSLTNEYEAINSEFLKYEDQAVQLANGRS